MKKTLEGACRLPGCEGLKLVAGKKGLGREIFWVSQVDSPDIVPFTNKGDFNFVTGVGPHGSKDWMAITEAAYERELAGLVFCPGSPYVKEMPQDIIDFGNEHDFPIFIIPWETKISDYSRIIGRYIEKEDDVSRTVSETLRDILTGKETLPLDDEVRYRLERQNIDCSGQFKVVIFRIDPLNGEKDIKYRVTYDEVHNILSKEFVTQGITVPLVPGIAILFNKNDENEKRFDREHVLQLKEMIKKFPLYDFSLGIGSTHDNMLGACESYHEAMLVINIYNGKAQQEKEIYAYNDLGSYKALYGYGNRKALIAFSEETLRPLIEYDRNNNSDLMHCLETFFDCDCNVKKTSEVLFVHKNTILYKIKKMDGLLGYPVFAQQNLFDLQLALMIKKMHC